MIVNLMILSLHESIFLEDMWIYAIGVLLLYGMMLKLSRGQIWNLRQIWSMGKSKQIHCHVCEKSFNRKHTDFETVMKECQSTKCGLIHNDKVVTQMIKRQLKRRDKGVMQVAETVIATTAINPMIVEYLDSLTIITDKNGKDTYISDA